MNLTDSRLAQAGNEKLELAMLSFFEQFRKIYIGDQVQKSSKVRPLPGNCEEAIISSFLLMFKLLEFDLLFCYKKEELIRSPILPAFYNTCFYICSGVILWKQYLLRWSSVLEREPYDYSSALGCCRPWVLF